MCYYWKLKCYLPISVTFFLLLSPPSPAKNTRNLHISNIQLSETEKKNLEGIFINGAKTLSLEENIQIFSAVQKFILNSGRFTYDANN